jgi:threonyl-tRNA synthetase
VIVVGAKEQETRTLNIRNRDDPATQKMGELIPLDKALSRLIELRDERRLVNKIDMSE